MITSTTTQLSGRFRPGSNNHQAVGPSMIIYPTLLPNERNFKKASVVENNTMQAEATGPQHIQNGVISTNNVGGSAFNSAALRAADLGPDRGALGINKQLASTYAEPIGVSMPQNRPTRESVLRRLSEALMRRSLTLIDMSQRGLQPSDARLVKLALLQNSSLSILKLGYNNLGDEGVKIISLGIAAHSSLSSLDLGFNNITDEGCRVLCSALLSTRGTLHTLYLSGNAIGEHGALSIADIIQKGCGLKRLHLTGNALGPEGVNAITEAIGVAQAHHHTHHLDKENLLLEQVVNRTDTFNKSPAKNDNNENSTLPHGVQELFLGGTRMGHDGCLAIAKMLEVTPTLRVLSLSNCDLGDDDILLLANSIKAYRDQIPLEALQLSFNNLSCKGTEALMNSVWGSQTLKEIRLDNNAIGDRGAQMVSAVLMSVKTLEKIDLGFNRISAHGMRSLMKAVAENERLLSISISGNIIDTGSAKAVAYALAYNRSLKSIFLDHCSIGEEGQRHITAGIVSNSGTRLHILKGFPIGGNAVSLGLPSALEHWTNEQVLKFILLMWEHMRQEQETSNSIEAELDPLHLLQSAPDDPTPKPFSGPLDPATVVSVAKRAFDSLGDDGGDFLSRNEPLQQEQQFESPVTEDAIMLEANDEPESVHRPPLYGVRSGVFSSSDSKTNGSTLKNIDEKSTTNDGNLNSNGNVEEEVAAAVRKKKIVEWLCQNIQLLNDLSKVTFNSTELWRLHQHYFTPVIHDDGCKNISPVKQSIGNEQQSISSTQPGSTTLSEPFVVSPSTISSDEQMPTSEPAMNASLAGGNGFINCIPMLKRKVSYRFLNEACLNSATQYDTKQENDGLQGTVSKLIEDMSTHSMQPKSKRARRNRSRISFLPRIKAKVDSYLDSCHQKALVLLRQLQYIEKAILRNSIYHLDPSLPSSHLSGYAANDAEIILLEMI